MTRDISDWTKIINTLRLKADSTESEAEATALRAKADELEEKYGLVVNVDWKPTTDWGKPDWNAPFTDDVVIVRSWYNNGRWSHTAGTYVWDLEDIIDESWLYNDE